MGYLRSFRHEYRTVNGVLELSVRRTMISLALAVTGNVAPLGASSVRNFVGVAILLAQMTSTATPLAGMKIVTSSQI